MVPFSLDADLRGLTEHSTNLSSVTHTIPRALPQRTVVSLPNRSGRNWIKYLAAAVIPFGVFWGMTLVLQDAEGNLVIESEIDAVKIRVVSENQASQDFSLRNGASVTRLKAGKYEIVLETASDEARIEPHAIELKKGERLSLESVA